jgi:HEAT repeat protein
MTLKRLLITVAVLVVLVTVGVLWLWQYAYSPTGRARTVFCQVRQEESGLRALLLRKNLIKPEITKEKVESQRRPLTNLDRGHVNLPSEESLVDWVAEERLEELGPKCWPAIKESLKDGDSRIRLIGIAASWRLREKRAVAALSDILRNPALSLEERQESASALGIIHDSAAIPALEATLQDKEFKLRFQAALALVEFGDNRSEPVLWEGCAGDTIFDAAPALLKVNPNSADAIIVQIEKSSETLQWHAMMGLGTYGKFNGGRKAVTKMFLKFLNDPKITKNNRIFAIDTLADIQDRSALEPIRKLLSDPDRQIREQAAYAMNFFEDLAPASTQPASTGAGR